MSITLKTQPKNKTDHGGKTMVTSRTEYMQSIKGVLLKVGKILLQVLKILLIIYLAFFSFLAVHEWMGHILADELVDTRHGTTLARIEVIVHWFSVNLQDGRWSVELVPFRIGGKVVSAVPGDPFTMTDWELGFGNFMGSGITALVSLVTLVVLNLRKDLWRFPWFAVFFSLFSVIFDQIFETFVNPTVALDSAVLMGADPLLFKILVISLVLLQGWLLVRIGIRYWRGKQARLVVNE
jgi:hypothetical protein